MAKHIGQPAMRFHIRCAEPSERDALTDIAHAAKRHWGYPPEWIALWRDDLVFAAESFNRWRIFCAVGGGGVVGVCSVSHDGPQAELENIWVLPEFIGQGIGRALFQHAAGQARRDGCRRLRIVSDPHAEAFYVKLGARRAGSVASKPEGRRLPCLEYDLRASGNCRHAGNAE